MSVSSSTNTKSFTGNASTGTPYVIPFTFSQPSDLVVVTTDTTTGNSTTLSLSNSPADYTVTQNADGTGQITTTNAVPSTSTVTISRSVPYTQLSSFVTGDRLPASTIETALDKLTYGLQQVGRAIGKCVRGSDSTADLTAFSAPPNDGGLYVLSATSNILSWVKQSTTTIGSNSVTPGTISTSNSTQWTFASLVNATAGFVGNLKGNILSSTGSTILNNTTSTFTGSVSGNVTGNCSGSSGSCTGNSATATGASTAIAASTLAASTAKAWVTFNPNSFTYVGATSGTNLWTASINPDTGSGTTTVTLTKNGAWSTAGWYYIGSSSSTPVGLNTTPAAIPLVGDWVTVAGATGVTGINGTFQITAVTTATPYTITYVVPSLLSGSAVVNSTSFSVKGITILGTSFNVSSIARGSTGNLTINFSNTPFADTNYLMTNDIFDFSGSSPLYLANPLVTLQSGIPTATLKTNAAITVAVNNSAGTLVDVSGNAQILFFGN